MMHLMIYCAIQTLILSIHYVKNVEGCKAKVFGIYDEGGGTAVSTDDGTPSITFDSPVDNPKFVGVYMDPVSNELVVTEGTLCDKDLRDGSLKAVIAEILFMAVGLTDCLQFEEGTKYLSSATIETDCGDLEPFLSDQNVLGIDSYIVGPSPATRVIVQVELAN